MEFRLSKQVRNSLIIAGIYFFTHLSVHGGIPCWETIYGALISGGLVFCIELGKYYHLIEKINPFRVDKNSKKNNKGTFFFS